MKLTRINRSHLGRATTRADDEAVLVMLQMRDQGLSYDAIAGRRSPSPSSSWTETALRLSSETGGVEKKLKPIPTGPGQLHIQKW